MPGMAAFALLTAVVIGAAAFDLRTGRVPNLLTHGSILAGLAMWTTFGALGLKQPDAWHGLGASAIGLVCALVPFAVLYAMGGLGGGDVKLMAAVGAIGASWQMVLACAFYAFIVGALMAVLIMIRHRIIGRTLRRLGGAALLAMARVRPDIPQDSPRVPFALAIAIGAVAAGLEHLLHWNMPWSPVG